MEHHSAEREPITDPRMNLTEISSMRSMDESQKHYAAQKKPDTEYTVQLHLYATVKKTSLIYMVTKTQIRICLGPGSRGRVLIVKGNTGIFLR